MSDGSNKMDRILKGVAIGLLCLFLVLSAFLLVKIFSRNTDSMEQNVPADSYTLPAVRETEPVQEEAPEATVPATEAPKETVPATEAPEVTEPDLDEEEESKQPGSSSSGKKPSGGNSSTPAESGVITVTGSVTAENNVVTEEASFSDNGVSATVSAGTLLDNNTTKLTLTVKEKKTSDSGVKAEAGQTLQPLDVHMDGVSSKNTQPITVCLGKILPNGMNIGNVTLYHVENGTANAMTQVMTAAELDAHNEFYYDPATGNTTVSLASFSEITVVSEESKWEGETATAFNSGSGTEGDPYIIANADQLVFMSKMVSDDEAYASAHYKLVSNVNLSGDTAQATDNKGLVFYPIGYWAEQDGTNSAGETYYGAGNSFCGTFDGNGNTISNIYQNTWLMDGDYDAGYWDTAMGLFGALYNATIKNLTVDNFQSDGEFTPTGCIAAYAGGPEMVFENIQLTGCNPRVYNTGNGGLVGLNYNSSSAGSYDNIVFRNVTVDQTNKISALWGSYDVSCGGILGRLRENSKHNGENEDGQKNTVTFENCHVAAIMDVNNDVCANYQYYQYRYSGMFIGTVDYIGDVPNVGLEDVVFADDSTYTYGDWNEYWYCELVKNSLASYTHDHQFSRLTKIADVSEIQDESGNWNKEGSFVLPNADNTAAECYHIFKDSEGNMYQHFHDAADESNPNIYETKDLNGDGELNDLKEDRQRYYIPFGQLWTGYGWGSSPSYNADAYDKIDITLREDGLVKSEQKFTANAAKPITTGDTVKLGDLFTLAVDESKLSKSTLAVFVSPVITDTATSTASAAVSIDTNNWGDSTLTFSGAGAAKVVITDYFYCTETVLNITVKDQDPVNKFDKLFTGDFLYRVGNDDTTPVKLGSLFQAKEGAEIGTVSVEIETINGASGTYTPNGTWTNGTIDFDGTGVVKVTITDNDYCIPTELYLEVVDAKNATGATSATSNNVVLLNDISGGFTVSGRYAVYGNGFTCTYTDNGQYLNNGLKQGVITISENGTLDNLRIKASIYPASYLYYEEAKNGPSTVDGEKARYHYQLSAVVAKGNATISNCYIYGGRTNIFVDTGDVTIKDTVLECGVLANIQVQSNSSHTVTLENVTTIQHQVNATVGDTTKVMLGAGVIVGPETNDNPTIVLNGEFKQYNWVTSADQSAVSNTTANTIIKTALNATAFNHTVNGATASNLGIIFLNDYSATVTNNTGLPYKLESVSMMGENGQVYSLQGATENQIYSDYENADKSTVNGLYVPQFKYSSDLGGQLVEKTDDGDQHCYRESDTIHVMFPSGDTKELDLAGLVNITKYTGQNLSLAITCVDESGNPVTVADNKLTLSTAGEYTVTYSVTDTLFYDKNGAIVAGIKNYSWDVTVSVSLKDASVPNAYFAFDSDKQTMGYAKKNALSGGNTQYLPFLAGLKIYDYVGQNAYLRFDGDNDFNKIASATITSYTSANHVLIEVKLTDGGVINIDTTARAASGGSTYTGAIKTSGNTIYYVNDGTTSATTTTWVISSYKFTGNNGVAIDSGSVTFSNCENGSVPTGSFSTTIQYTVTYDANGGDCGQTVGYATSASNAVALPTATRSGYTFLGWYTAATGGTNVGSAGGSYTPSANITLYAQWGAPCTVTYDANGGSCDTESEKFNGKTLVLPEATRDGYTFLGWYTAAEGGERIGPAGMSYNPMGDITLYAHWQVPITVTYNANGGSCETTSELFTGDLTLPEPKLTGYTCTGWYTDAEGGTKVGDAGSSYEPTEDITLYAQWEKTLYTITVTTSNATVTGVTNGQSAYYGDTITFAVTYSGSSNKTTTVTDADGNTVTTTGSYTFTMPASDVTISASSSTTCVTADTLVTLADGTQKRIDQVTFADQLLVWDFDNGAYTVANSSIIENHGYGYNNVIKLTFADGTTTKIVNVHGFFDADLDKWVDIDADNVQDFIGHSFTQVDGNTYKTNTLISAEATTEYVEAWSILSADHYNCILDGMFSVTPPATIQLAFFEIGENMKYDAEAKQADIDKYGLYTYEEFAHLLTEAEFDALNIAEIKVAVGKGLITYDEVIWLINTYIAPL